MNVKIDDRIHVRDIQFFNNFQLSLRYDSVGSLFSFDFYFDPKNPQHRETACISHFHEAIVQHNGETLVTGYILQQAFSYKSQKTLTKLSGYSKPGVLEDCAIPKELYPIQWDGLNLAEITQKLLAPFKLKFQVDPAVSARVNKPYSTVKAEVGQTIKDFLNKLASDRNIIISHDVYGNLLYTQANTKAAPLVYFDGTQNGVEMSLTFNGQGIHSEITVMKQADSDGGNAGEITIKNPYCPIVYRPTVVTQGSGDDNDTQEAARSALSKELQAAINLNITVSAWEVQGKTLKPNTIISVVAPELYIFKPTRFFVESVDYTGNSEGQTATMKCVLPEVYDNGEIINIFVDIHKNAGGL